MSRLNSYDLNSIIKPSRYIGGEYNQVIKNGLYTKFAICFPNIYETSIDNIDLKTIYGMINNRDDTWCERVYSPNTDFENLMRKKKIKLYGLESKSNLDSFDIISFYISDEMLYTNVLNMIDLCNIPLYSKDRQIRFPFIIALGDTTINPHPMSQFIDIFIIGEFEKVIDTLLDKYIYWKENNNKKIEYLESIKDIEGIYIPKIHTDKNLIKRAIVENIENIEYNLNPIVSNMANNKDRIYLEIARNNKYNFLNENVRQNSLQRLMYILENTYKSTGIKKVCLNFNNIETINNKEEILNEIIKFSDKNKLDIFAENLIMNEENINLLKNINCNSKSSITLNIHASSQRLRDLINENIDEEYIINFAKKMFENEFYTLNIKFMIGLPTEDYSDLNSVVELCDKIKNEYFKIVKDDKNIKLNIIITTELFIPKPYTILGHFKMASKNKLEMKQSFFKDKLYKMGIKYIYDDIFYKKIKALLINGDSRICRVIYNSWRLGSRFDINKDKFDSSFWDKALERENINIEEYINSKVINFGNINVGIKNEYINQRYDEIKRKLRL